MLGTITTLKRWDPISRTGGYGFLRDDEGYDRFFHARDLVLGAPAFGTVVAEGARVTFEPTAKNGDKQGRSNGLRAIKVDLVHTPVEPSISDNDGFGGNPRGACSYRQDDGFGR